MPAVLHELMMAGALVGVALVVACIQCHLYLAFVEVGEVVEVQCCTLLGLAAVVAVEATWKSPVTKAMSAEAVRTAGMRTGIVPQMDRLASSWSRRIPSHDHQQDKGTHIRLGL